MSSIVLSGDTSGAITIAAPAVAGTNTLTLPAKTGTVLTTASTGVCVAWVNFDGTSSGTITPRASYNVTNVTKVSTGVYTINFTSALADANYCVNASVSATSGNTTLLCNTQTNGSGSTAPSTTAVSIAVVNRSAGAATDSPYINVQIFR